MLVLAIDTSAKDFSIAILDDESVLCRLDSVGSGSDLPPEEGDSSKVGVTQRRASISKSLIPLISEASRKLGIPIAKLDLISVATGPGLFTGLRIGVVTAKTLAYASAAKLIGVNTLEAIAYQAAISTHPKPDQRIRCVLNAQRQQLFAATYQYKGGNTLDILEPDAIVSRPSWTDAIGDGDVLSGSGMRPFLDEIIGINKRFSNCILTPVETWVVDAVTVGRIGLRNCLAGDADDLWELEPVYYRPSAAEEVAAAKDSSTDA